MYSIWYFFIQADCNQQYLINANISLVLL